MAKKHRQNAAKSSAEVDETVNEAVALLTTAQVAKRAKCSQEYIRRLERQGIIEKEARGQWLPEVVDDVIAHRARRNPGFDQSLIQERTKLVRVQRQKAEYELAERRSQLQTREENEADARHLATDVRGRMAIAHARCVKRLGLNKFVADALADEIKDAISELVEFGGLEA
jgi:hypothetical protein